MTLPPRPDSGVRITIDAVPKPGKELEYGRDLDDMLAQARSWPGCRTAAYFRTDTGFEMSMVFDTPTAPATGWGATGCCWPDWPRSAAPAWPGRSPPRPGS